MSKRTSPRNWTDELKSELCRRIAEGETILAMAGKHGFPSQAAVYTELRRDPDFAKEYELAREFQMSVWEDQIIEIANDSSKDRLPDGRIDCDHISRMKLLVHTKMWVMARRAPKRYGDRISTELSGPGGSAIEIKRELSPVEVARQIAFVLELGKHEVGKRGELLELSTKEYEG